VKDKLLLFSLAFAIPIFALLAAAGLRVKMQHDWSTAVQSSASAHNQSGQLTERAREFLSLANVCSSNVGSEFQSYCSTYASYEQLERYSTLTAIGTAALLILIAISGYVARFDRHLLLAFVPGMFLTLITLAVLILVNSGLLIFSLYSVMSTFLSRIPVGLMIAIGIGAVIAVFRMLAASKGFIRKAEVTVVGKRLDEAVNYKLVGLIDDLCSRMGSLKPQHIVVGLDPNFFVTEADVRCLDGVFKGRTLYLSLTLCRILSTQEFQGVLAHEFGHFVGLDTQFSRKFYPVYRGTSESLSALFAHSQGNGAGGLAALPASLILTYFLYSFSVAENKIGRDRELHADSLAATATSRSAFASALVKIHAFTSCWSATKNHMIETIKSGKQIVNASAFFAAVVNQCASDVPLNGLVEATLSHPTDTHPPLGLRLKSLNESVDDVSSDVRQTSPAPPASDLFADCDSLEQELSDVENALLSERIAPQIINEPPVETASVSAH